MAVYMVGDFIREIRLRKGYTQEEVSFGICTPASLSRIENGMQTPGRYVLDKLLERLGTENNVFSTFVSREEMELYEIVQMIARNIADGNVSELEQQIKKMERLVVGKKELERQYLFFAQGELLRQRGGDEEAVMDLLMRAIHVTLPGFDGRTPLKNNLLTFDEIIIINSIATQYAERSRIEDALRLGFWLKDYMEEKVVDGKMKTAKYPVILYNLSNWLGETERFKDALRMADIGIDFCIRYGHLLTLPLLMFNKACSLAELRRFEEAKKFFAQSVTVFEAMKQYNRAKMATDWCKKHYEIKL